jgi:predicted helicase
MSFYFNLAPKLDSLDAQDMTALNSLLNTYRTAAQSEREKGTYFEELMLRYFAFEPQYRDLYAEIRTYADWAKSQGLPATDTGIDLVATTRGTGEFHAIQCKLYATDYVLQKKDIDSFFTASGKTHFSHRIIVSTCEHWSKHAEDALADQQPPVTKIDLYALENSQIAWEQYQPNQDVVLKPKKSLRDHQKTALESVEKGLSTASRGKLIMACGTGKTFTSLKIAEKLAGCGKRVLFLVPSLSLLSQTLTEWTQESDTPLHSFAVCSDSDVGKKKKTSDDDAPQLKAHELQYPATTNAKRLAEEMSKRHDAEHMSVVFSTYHSINVISDAQLAYQMAEFDLIICDEAHRTTGATFADEDESNFVRVHDDEFVLGKKRLYMTATPRIYGEAAKENAKNDQVAICSMDDERLFGQELYTISFSEAVKRELLCDYKVIVLSVDEAHVNRRMQKLLSDDNNQLKVDDAAKIIGCWKALSKQDTQEDLIGDTHPMRRAVAFCQVIDPSPKAKTHKVSSKNIAGMFQAVVEAYQDGEVAQADDVATWLRCEAEHVDGGMNASQKEAKLQWLKADTPEQNCRILSNVRCLSEGVDVPALDAVLFLTPRNSQVDVVQSVGRVMRKAEGKTRGYVILPVVIPAGVEPHDALNDNKTYKVVWQVLQALRSHDDRFDAMVNKMDLELNKSMLSKMEVIAITDKINKRSKASNTPEQQRKKRVAKARGSQSLGTDTRTPQPEQIGLEFEIGEIERAIYAKVVQKCGNRRHWEDWAADIAKIARTHIDRIQAILADPTHTREIAAFEKFAAELRDDLNNSISDSEIVEMLAQHLITKPVFDALFDEYSFASKNPMSLAMQEILDTLHEHRLDKEADTLNTFYDSVKERAKGIESAEGKQKIIVELYDKFFRNAFPKMTEKLGIVYTPVEVVDFILHSVNDVLKQEFGQTIGSKGVHVIDPFTGTGTFISRLIQSDLIADDEIIHKYKHELHANEIVLLAYYIAAINIEASYHGRVIDEYTPFQGICLTDTFQMYEKDDLVSAVLVDNSARRTKQKNLDIRVIVGNPPYSAGQDSANDNNANVSYPYLDQRIRETYVDKTNYTNKTAIYDSYIRAIRWASDRLGEKGVIGFVTNAGFVDSNSADGLRKCLVEEFSSLYIFHLRGNARTSGEQRRKEKDNVFGQGTRTPIAVSLLVKNPNATETGKIHFYDIGDYLSREEKLEKISDFASIQALTDAQAWQVITPDQHGDWLAQRNDDFSHHIRIGDKKNKDSVSVFQTYSAGVKTNRDAWCCNFSVTDLTLSMSACIDFYNHQVLQHSENNDADIFLNMDETKIKWTQDVISDVKKGRFYQFEKKDLYPSLYRPYTPQWLYFNKKWNWSRYLMPSFFPSGEQKNLTINLSGIGFANGFSVIMSNLIPSHDLISKGQCFPLYLYEPTEQATPADDLFSRSDDGLDSPQQPQYTRRDAITDDGLAHFADYYAAQTNGETISKEDLFYYIYGLLHSEDYRSRYADNLSKELPRIPRVKTYAHFKHFSDAGRQLAHYHLNYESVEPYPVNFNTDINQLSGEDFYVTKMKFAKGKGDERHDKTTMIYNHKITMSGIPLEAYDYVVNGKPALEWVIERQCVKTDKDSGIVNDANDWAIETMHNPRYPLELFQRVITVSLETMKIVNGLPKLEID